MNTTDIITIAVLVGILGAAVYFLIRAKKRGQACIGCPHAKECKHGCSCDSQKQS